MHEDFRRRGLPNRASLAFHRGRGFLDVGERDFDGHRVAMLVKRLGA